MTPRVQVGGLSVAATLHNFVESEALPGTGIAPGAFWAGAEAIFADLAPRNCELLARRDELQNLMDDYHRATPGEPEPVAYKTFLQDIGYLVPEPDDFEISTSGADFEITDQAGPQLVVPLLNARFAINAANARWGSLYDAVYGTDVIPEHGELAREKLYNPLRGAEVIAFGRRLLDDSFPLRDGSHAEVTSYAIDADGLAATLDGRP
ncbi:MAG: malate synthase, partial [Aeromicrobium sp.]|nr:malate synthase [Aeromicrobium sp.]